MSDRPAADCVFQKRKVSGEMHCFQVEAKAETSNLQLSTFN